MHKLRMQNIHLLKLSANAGGKCDQAQVERLQDLLQTEKNKNRTLTEQMSSSTTQSISKDGQNEMSEQLQRYMRQSLEDSEKLTEWSKKVTNFERQMKQLKSENATLKIRLTDLKNQHKTPSTSSLPKENTPSEPKVEQIFFNQNDDSKIASVATSEKPLLKAKENVQVDDEFKMFLKPEKSEKKPKKSVSFDCNEESKDASKDDEGKSPSKKPKMKRVPRFHNEVINAEEKTKNMEEQCKQQ